MSSASPIGGIQRRTIPPSIVERTEGFAGREWVADEVADWLVDGNERFLAITGEPGSGKTALAAWFAGAGPAPKEAVAATTLERVRGAWTAIHFCIPREAGTVDGESFGASIAGQLAAGLGDQYLPAVVRANDAPLNALVKVQGDVYGTVIAAQIKELVIARQSRADTAAHVSAVWRGAVRLPLQELEKTPPGPRVLILVDALDEAAREPDPNIVTLLKDANDFPSGVRFLVTMSTKLNARELFPGARIVDLSSPASEGNANDDVRAYLRAELDPSREVEDRLVAAASGNFLYVHFFVEEVRAGTRSLDDIEGLPRGLYPLYSRYLDRLTGTDPGLPPRTKWERDLQPLIGCISVATPSAPGAVLPLWLRKDAGRVNRLLADARQLTEVDQSPDGLGHRLYHRSMSDYLAATEYGTGGDATVNRYHTPPQAQHARIAGHYLANFEGPAWRQADSYGLRHVGRHLAASAAEATLPVERRRRTADLYRTILDPDFQAAQKAGLGDLHSTLADLRLGVETALAGDETVALLRCVAGYRGVARAGAIAEGIFDAVDRGDFATALRDAEHYGPPPRPRGRWARVLDAWIAWHAARNGRADEARRAAEGVVGQWRTFDSEAEPLYWQLCRALIVRAGRALAAAGGDPDAMLRAFPQEHAALTAEVAAPPAPPASDADMASLLINLAFMLEQFEIQLREDPYEAVEMPFANAEAQTWQAMSLRAALMALAARPEGRAGIDRTLGPTLSNPYARYRDIGLVALGGAVVAVPDDAWADGRLRSILLAGLDAEGVTFTFDLPSVLQAECRRRGLEDVLGPYLEQARALVAAPDRWSTGLRALNAEAAARLAVGDRDGAMDTLVEASRLEVGFAGYASGAYLALANRCIEVGRSEAVWQSMWGAHGWTLTDLAAEHARKILDEDFRQERIALVERYAQWLREPPPDMAAVETFMGVTPDPDARRAYKDFASAHWAAAGSAETREWLASLVPMVLEDTTTLDTILARFIASRMPGLPDREITDAAVVVATGLTSGRPWDLGINLERPEAR